MVASKGQVTFGVGVDGLKDLSKDLAAIDKQIRQDFGGMLRAAAQPVVDQATANAGFSTRIPGTIRVKAAGGTATATIRVTAGGNKAPGAAALEHGGMPGSFRHKVFGHDVWVEQPARPFLLPALVTGADQVVERVADGTEAFFRAHGWR